MNDFAKLVLAADTTQMKAAAADLNAVSAASGRAEKSSQTLAAAIKIAAAAAVALSLAAGLAARRFIAATSENERVQAQLAAAIRSTGAAAQRTVEQLNESAAALQGVTIYGDEAINSMQALLLTFTQISGSVFDRATEAILNVATAMGTDMNSAALQVGKALNDPILGMTALTRSGIQFTEEQKNLVRGFVEMGDVVSAQNIILEELERQFGGSARAARETLGGALKSLGNAWGDLFELSGDASDSLRASIESLIDVVTDPRFQEAFQNIGSGIFKAMTAAIESVTGLYLLFMDTRAFLGFSNAEREVVSAIEAANEAMDLQILASGSLATQGLEPGARVSRAYALAQIDIMDATIGAMDAMRQQNAVMVTQSRAYQDLQNRADLLEDLVRVEEQLARQRQLTMSETDRLVDENATARVIAVWQAELESLREAQQALVDTASQATPEYAALVAEADRLREAIASGTGATVVLGGETEELAQDLGVAGQTAEALAATLASMQMGSQPAGQAAILAQQLGIALDVATRLNATLNRTAGLQAAQGPRLGFGGLGSTLDNGLANGMANTVLGFGNVTDAADETWRAVEDLTVGVGDLTGALGGGSPGGGGATESAEDLRKAFDDLIASLDPTVAATQRMTRDQKIAKDALDAGVVSAEEYADAIAKIKEEYDEAMGGGDEEHPLLSALESLDSAFHDLMENGLEDFDSFADSLVKTFSQAVAKMVAEAAAAQLGQSLGMFAGPVGSIIGGIAGGLLGRMFGGGRSSSAQGEADRNYWSERIGLMDQYHEAMGNTEALLRRELNQLDPRNRELGKKIQLLEKEAAIEQEKLGLQQQWWSLTGQTNKLRQYELSLLDKTNRELQKRIWAVEDRRAARALGIDAPANGNSAPGNLQEHLGLQKQLWVLEGKTGKLRRLELQSLDKSNRELQKRIWALQDEQEESRKAREEARAIAQDRRSLRVQLLELMGRTDELRELELKQLDESLHPLQLRIWAMQDEKKAADEAAAAAERLADSLSTDQFKSLFAYERAVGLARFGNMTPANSTAAPEAVATGGTSGTEQVSSSDVLLSKMLSRLARMEQTLRKWDSEGQPPERAYA